MIARSDLDNSTLEILSFDFSTGADVTKKMKEKKHLQKLPFKRFKNTD